MKKCLLFILMGICSISVFGNNINLARQNFTKIKNSQQIDALLTLISKEETPIANAYKGAFIMMKAKYVQSPFKKYNYFNQGKILIEQAINEAPNDIETHYLRAILQANLPKFLNYYENISADVNFVLTNIKTATIPKEVKYKIITNLVAVNLISDTQKTTIFYQLNYERNTSNIGR